MAWLVIIIQFQLQNDSSNSYAIKKKISSEIDIVKFSIKCILECRNNDELIYTSYNFYSESLQNYFT